MQDCSEATPLSPHPHLHMAHPHTSLVFLDCCYSRLGERDTLWEGRGVEHLWLPSQPCRLAWQSHLESRACFPQVWTHQMSILPIAAHQSEHRKKDMFPSCTPPSSTSLLPLTFTGSLAPGMPVGLHEHTNCRLSILHFRDLTGGGEREREREGGRDRLRIR